jgi:MATE family multidrug resistance protein
MNNNQLLIGWKDMLKVALPVSLGVFVQFIVVFIDNYFVAKLDGNAMSAASFVGLIYVTMAMIGVGLGNATQIIVARRKGENNINEAGEVVGNAFWMALLVAAFQFCFLFFLLPAIIENTIDSPIIRAYMTVFSEYRAFGFFFYTLTLILNSFWAGIAHTRVMIATTLITALVTILLDYGLVFGNLGLPNLGMAGAALATTIAEACAFTFLIWYTIKYHHKFTFSKTESGENSTSMNLGKSILSIPVNHTKSLFKLGGPISLQLVSSLGIWVIFYEFIESMGEQPLQSSFIVRNMYMLVYVSVGGFSTTIKTYVSGLIAENRQSELHAVIFKLTLMNFIGILLLSHGLWLYPEWITSHFTSDPIVIDQTIRTMHIVLPAMLTFSVTSMLLSTVEGSGNTMAGFIIEFITVIIYIAAAYTMVYNWHWPIHLVWTADYVYFISLGILSFVFLYNGKWKWNKV